MRPVFTRKTRFLFVYPLFIWLVVAGRTTEPLLRLGIGLAALGMLVRLWANGYVGHVKVNWTQRRRGDAKIGRLVTAGPYAFVRHPLYLGTLMLGAGFCLIAGNLWAGLAAGWCFWMVYRRKMAQEEILLREEVGTPFLAYQAAVPRLLPGWRRYEDRRGRWSWQGVVASKEWKTLIWVVVVILGLYFREELMQEQELFRPHAWVKHAVLLSVACLLMLTDGVVELFVRRKQALQRAIGGKPGFPSYRAPA